MTASARARPNAWFDLIAISLLIFARFAFFAVNPLFGSQSTRNVSVNDGGHDRRVRWMPRLNWGHARMAAHRFLKGAK